MVSNAIVIGAAAAVGLAVLAIGIAVCCCRYRRRRRKVGDGYASLPVVRAGTPMFAVCPPSPVNSADAPPPRRSPAATPDGARQSPARDFHADVYPPVAGGGRRTLESAKKVKTMLLVVKKDAGRRQSMPADMQVQHESLQLSGSRPASRAATPSEDERRSSTPGISPERKPKGRAHQQNYNPIDSLPEQHDDARRQSSLQSTLDGYAKSANEARVRSLERESSEARLGQVEMQLEYIYREEKIRFRLIKAKDLPAMDIGGTSDPYVDVTMIDSNGTGPPKRVAQWRSQYKNKTLNPVFNEQFDFPCAVSIPLRGISFLLYVYDHDSVSRDDLIGHIWLPLKGLDLVTRPRLWQSVVKGKMNELHPDDAALGELEVGLSYDTSTHNLIIIVTKAKGLPLSKGKPPNTFVKVRVYHGDVRIASKETAVFRQCCDPEFQEEFAYRLNASVDVHNLLISIIVNKSTRIGKKQFGMICIGTTSLAHPLGSDHWRDVLDHDGAAVYYAHELQPFSPVLFSRSGSESSLSGRR